MKEIKPEDIWNEEKIKQIGEFIKEKVAKQTPEQRKRIEELSEKYKKLYNS